MFACTLFQIILSALLFKVPNPPSPDFHKLVGWPEEGRHFRYIWCWCRTRVSKRQPILKCTPRTKLSVSNLIHVLFIYFFLLLFWSNSIPIIARNSSKTVLLPSQQLTNSSSPCTHRDSVGTSSRDSRVLNFRSQNNKARLKGSISVKGRRYGSKNASSVISHCHQPPSISLKHFDSYLLRRSCRTITEENVLGFLFQLSDQVILTDRYSVFIISQMPWI